MNRLWVFGLLILAVSAGSLLCACEPDCCPLPPTSQASDGGSSPLEGPNCPCASATESDQRAPIDLTSCLLAEFVLPEARGTQSPRGVSVEQAYLTLGTPSKLFVTNHQLVI